MVLPARVVSGLVRGELPPAPFAYDAGTFAEDRPVLVLRDRQLQDDPASEPWLLRAVVLRVTGEVVGRIGLHAPPDATGTVEVGYVVAPAHRRRGYAREAVQGLLGWAAAHGATRCLASVSPGNAASLALVRQLGFVQVGEHVDEVDGLELVHALDLAGTR